MSKKQQLSEILPQLSFQELVSLETIQAKFMEQTGDFISDSQVIKCIGKTQERIKNKTISDSFKSKIKTMINIAGGKNNLIKVLNFIN